MRLDFGDECGIIAAMREVIRLEEAAPAAGVSPWRVAGAAGWRENVVTVHLLALCPMLAVSVSVTAAAALGGLTTAVMAVAGGMVAAGRRWTPDAVRLPVLLIVVAALVAVVDVGMAVGAPALHRELGIFLPLIVTNCAVLARLEVFARRQPVWAAVADGVGSGVGMTAALVGLAVAREGLGTGGLGGLGGLGEGAWFAGAPLALMPAGGFVLFGVMLAGRNALVGRKCTIIPP